MFWSTHFGIWKGGAPMIFKDFDLSWMFFLFALWMPEPRLFEGSNCILSYLEHFPSSYFKIIIVPLTSLHQGKIGCNFSTYTNDIYAYALHPRIAQRIYAELLSKCIKNSPKRYVLSIFSRCGLRTHRGSCYQLNGVRNPQYTLRV